MGKIRTILACLCAALTLSLLLLQLSAEAEPDLFSEAPDVLHRPERTAKPVYSGHFMPVEQDPYEPDDTVAQANLIATDGTLQTHNFEPAGDHDWVKFTAKTGLTYVVETSNLGDQCDTYIYLYDTDATTILDEDDDSGYRLASLICFTCAKSGVYYVMARHYNSEAHGEETNYDISVKAYTLPPLTETWSDERDLPTLPGCFDAQSIQLGQNNEVIRFKATLFGADSRVSHSGGLYIDSDMDSSTGYQYSPYEGADYQIYFWWSGWYSEVSLYKYNATTGWWDYRDTVPCCGYSDAYVDFFLERSQISVSPGAHFRFKAYLYSSFYEWVEESGVWRVPLLKRSSITLDGDPSDWKYLKSLVSPLISDEVDEAPCPEFDFTGLYVTIDKFMSLFLRVDSGSSPTTSLNIGTGISRGWYVYLDTDNDNSTGYPWGTVEVGADHMLRLYAGESNDGDQYAYESVYVYGWNATEGWWDYVEYYSFYYDWDQVFEWGVPMENLQIHLGSEIPISLDYCYASTRDRVPSIPEDWLEV